MAYGTPRDLDDVERYYTDIRRGRPPSTELLEELVGRYEAIGGQSPLLEITEAQARGMQERLGVPAYLGQKHTAPFIRDAVEAMHADGVERAAGIVLAPHYSSMSIGDYARRAERAAHETGWHGRLEMVTSWHLEPGYVDWLTARVGEALEVLGEPEATVIFSAHSLPAKILERGDPYPDQLAETARTVASRAGLAKWTVGWQSAGRTDEPWLGPDILEVITGLAGRGERAVVSCPCGFVADHLEVLYDIDIEAKQRAAELGMSLVRTRSPNDDPVFLDMLAGVVQRALDIEG